MLLVIQLLLVLLLLLMLLLLLLLRDVDHHIAQIVRDLVRKNVCHFDVVGSR